MLSVLANEIQYEPKQDIACPVLQYPGLKIRLERRKVLREKEEVALIQLEYGILTYLTTYLGQVFSKQQIYEAI